jgi:hypothetical protein
MLFAVNEYCREREDPGQPVTYHQIGSLVGGEYQLEQVYLFKQLVDEGFINAMLYKGWKGGPPFSHAQIVGLRRPGHQFISEMSREQDELIEKLDEIIEALGRLEPDKKKRGERVIQELKLFIRSLTHQEARLFIEELIQRLSSYAG